MSDLFWIAVLGVGLYALGRASPQAVYVVASPPSSGGISAGMPGAPGSFFRQVSPPAVTLASPYYQALATRS